jgi:hypothetical protein
MEDAFEHAVPGVPNMLRKNRAMNLSPPNKRGGVCPQLSRFMENEKIPFPHTFNPSAP